MYFSRCLCLTHLDWVMHVWISKWTIIGSADNGLSPGRHQAIFWTNTGILSMGHLGTNFNEISLKKSYIFIQENPFENVVWKMVAILSWPLLLQAFIFCTTYTHMYMCMCMYIHIYFYVRCCPVMRCFIIQNIHNGHHIVHLSVHYIVLLWVESIMLCLIHYSTVFRFIIIYWALLELDHPTRYDNQ